MGSFLTQPHPQPHLLHQLPWKHPHSNSTGSNYCSRFPPQITFACFRTSQKLNQSAYTLLINVSFTQYILDSSMLLYIYSKFIPFYWWIAAHWMNKPVCLSILLRMDSCAVSRFGLLEIKQWLSDLVQSFGRTYVYFPLKQIFDLNCLVRVCLHGKC